MEQKYEISYIDAYLALHDETRYSISNSTGLPESTLSNAVKSKRGSDGISGIILKKFGEALNKTPGTVLDELLLVEAALANLNENKPFVFADNAYWTSVNDPRVVWTDEKWIKSQVIFCLNEWLYEFDDEERAADEFYLFAWRTLENDDAFIPSDNAGNKIDLV